MIGLNNKKNSQRGTYLYIGCTGGSIYIIVKIRGREVNVMNKNYTIYYAAFSTPVIMFLLGVF